MRKFYQSIYMGIGILLMASCQMYTGGGFLGLYHSDDAITAAVNQAMVNHRDLSQIPIRVETHQGNVLLSGYVKTIRQSDTAGDVAAKVPGVKSVENNLIVRK
ncbi:MULTISPECIES: BON domain-containing protein [unclassified Legionella]|uniref:BON domain-containing protein n=1 Tax=unclassified Legionella TaxID=2622702 RepID=UPI0010564706|nr:MULTISPECIES: BON domain-containing protein [unclassified Legionella]MDI9817919.1 BON domain-containing protein [Legionella sp. PL877]